MAHLWIVSKHWQNCVNIRCLDTIIKRLSWRIQVPERLISKKGRSHTNDVSVQTWIRSCLPTLLFTKSGLWVWSLIKTFYANTKRHDSAADHIKEKGMEQTIFPNKLGLIYTGNLFPHSYDLRKHDLQTAVSNRHDLTHFTVWFWKHWCC